MSSLVKMRPSLLRLLVLGIVMMGFAASGIVYSQQANQEGQADSDDHETAGETTYWTLKVNDQGEVSTDEKGVAQWVRMDPPEDKAAPPEVRNLEAAQEAVVNVNCRTTSTNTSGRKTCNDYEVHQLPPDYVFAQTEVRTVWHSDIGSSNYVNVSWEDRADISLDSSSGYLLPRRMKVHGHARSGHGFGERGHTNATVHCRFFKRLPGN